MSLATQSKLTCPCAFPPGLHKIVFFLNILFVYLQSSNKVQTILFYEFAIERMKSYYVYKNVTLSQDWGWKMVLLIFSKSLQYKCCHCGKHIEENHL